MGPMLVGRAAKKKGRKTEQQCDERGVMVLVIVAEQRAGPTVAAGSRRRREPRVCPAGRGGVRWAMGGLRTLVRGLLVGEE